MHNKYWLEAMVANPYYQTFYYCIVFAVLCFYVYAVARIYANLRKLDNYSFYACVLSLSVPDIFTLVALLVDRPYITHISTMVTVHVCVRLDFEEGSIWIHCGPYIGRAKPHRCPRLAYWVSAGTSPRAWGPQ